MDAEQVRREIAQTRASMDRKLDLLSSRTSELAGSAKDTMRLTVGALLIGAGASIAWTWWRRRA